MNTLNFLARPAVFLLCLFGQSLWAQVGTGGKDWISLFNGKDINDWVVKIHHHETGDNYGRTFRVENGVIKVSYDQYGQFNDRFGHLYYKTPFSFYHLVVEYRFTGEWRKDAPSYTILNSGVMYHSQAKTYRQYVFTRNPCGLQQQAGYTSLHRVRLANF